MSYLTLTRVGQLELWPSRREMWLLLSFWSCQSTTAQLRDLECSSAVGSARLFATGIHTRGFFLLYLRQRSHTPITVQVDRRSGHVVSTYASMRRDTRCCPVVCLFGVHDSGGFRQVLELTFDISIWLILASSPRCP